VSTIDGGDFTALRLGSDIGGDGVEFDERHAVQTIPLMPEIRRRSRGFAGVDNWLYGVLENVHSAADAEASTFVPYSPGFGEIFNGYPAAMPEGYDLWLLSIYGRRSAGAGGLTAAGIGFLPGDRAQGWGIDDSGAGVETSVRVQLAMSTALETGATAISTPPMIFGNGLTHVDMRMRLPRGCDITFVTESAAAAEFQAIIVMGLFPMALGQDVLS